jgi:hypothetical protein
VGQIGVVDLERRLRSDRLDVRLGAIYALERIMIDSAPDHPAIVDVLAAFVRECLPAAPSGPDLDTGMQPEKYLRPAPDLQAAVTVLGRRPAGRSERGRVNLAGAALAGADLTGAVLAGADLARVNLFQANLAGADLAGADLTRTDLGCANLTGANLTFTNLTLTNLDLADLTGADLTGADLTEASLGGTNLTGVTLTGEQRAAMQTNPPAPVLPRIWSPATTRVFAWRYTIATRYLGRDRGRDGPESRRQSLLPKARATADAA